jgi:hypothetical protein
MSSFAKYEPCPRCREQGRDRRGDNLGRYRDGSGHCFSCGYHERPSATELWKVKDDEPKKSTGPFPRDFTRDVPAMAWKWLLQYGLPYSYWKPYTGYSPAEERLVITHGNPVETSVGRLLQSGVRSGESGVRQVQERNVGMEGASRSLSNLLDGGSNQGTQGGSGKWKQWGDKLRSATILDGPEGGPSEIVLVEDIVSAHKVRQVQACLPLFGVTLYTKVLATLRALKRPVALWLDRDQLPLLGPKLNTLQTFLDAPVRFISTDKDPKKYDTEEIRKILSAA